LFHKPRWSWTFGPDHFESFLLCHIEIAIRLDRVSFNNTLRIVLECESKRSESAIRDILGRVSETIAELRLGDVNLAIAIRILLAESNPVSIVPVVVVH
jgi:hypothetical protein